MTNGPKPYRVVLGGTSLESRTDQLGFAMLEAERLARIKQAQVQVYDGPRLLKTFDRRE